MKHFKSFAFLMLLLCCSMYSYWLSNKDFEWIVPYMGDRAPAAVKDSEEFQKIIEKPMRVFKREAVVSSISIDNRHGRQMFSMGQFPVASAKGPNLICLEYPYVRLNFIADGQAVSGKQPAVKVGAPCQINPKNKDLMSDIPLPFHDLQRWPAQDQHTQYTDPNNMMIDLKFEHMRGTWPNQWLLESVKFSKDPNGESEEQVIINQVEVLNKLGQPVAIQSGK